MFDRFSRWLAVAVGRPSTFVLAVVVILVWAATGPVFAYNDTWQLVINTGTTIITFLMVFMIQNTQNRNDAALHAKLDAIIHELTTPDELIGVEELTAEEIAERRQRALQVKGSTAMDVRQPPEDGQALGQAHPRHQGTT